ncbi:TonB-dependent receptor [Aurantiacibacter flavus]|uniref:TonB-dependent receptor n=1 Tax=Aurantiacibacter flavus TaxID=3145232 RepID=A0ABV0D0W4_9SPHN
MSGIRWLAVGAPLMCAVAACPATAQDISFDVPAGPLNAALISFATRANVSIDTSDLALRSIRVAGLRGRYSVRQGLRQLLRGTGYDFRIGRGNVVRLFRRPTRRIEQAQPRPATPKPTPLPAPPLPPPPPIIVTASKQDVRQADFPGTSRVVTFDESRSLYLGRSGSEALLREFPNLTSTNLGSGRNKIFIRGIADSSFNGQLQSTVSQYLGESRLTYSAPDPDLALYDIDRVEIVEGPQGTLYGAGSLGGVIRMVPRAPTLGEFSFSGTASLGVTGNRLANDSAVVANVPIGDRAALRMLGYRILRPGYIDDVQRNLSDINRTSVSGGRATFRMEFNERFSIYAGLVSQDTASEDGQYTDYPGSSELTRSSLAAQPFDNDYRLAFATLRADLGTANLVSNTSYNIHPIVTVFDASPPDTQVPIVFEEDVQVKLLTHETRISGSADLLSSWVSGVSLAFNINDTNRFLGPENARVMISNIQSETLDVALFGEATLPILRDISLTAGGRLSHFTRFDEFTVTSGDAPAEPSRPEIRFLPTVAISWKPLEGGIAYVRYQQGYRPGAQQLTGTGDQAKVTSFEPDAVSTAEIGMRFGTSGRSLLSGGLSYSYSKWSRVQADLVSSEGFPVVANVGSARIHYVAAHLAWNPAQDVSLGFASFYTTGELDRQTNVLEGEIEANLPNVADRGWRFSGRYEPWIGDTKITLDGSVEYIGTSFLGISAPFDIPQGNYIDTALGIHADFECWGLSLSIDNVLDSRANRFSLGNPFSVAEGNQRTPLRPRTVTIGIDARF